MQTRKYNSVLECYNETFEGCKICCLSHCWYIRAWLYCDSNTERQMPTYIFQPDIRRLLHFLFISLLVNKNLVIKWCRYRKKMFYSYILTWPLNAVDILYLISILVNKNLVIKWCRYRKKMFYLFILTWPLNVADIFFCLWQHW